MRHDTSTTTTTTMTSGCYVMEITHTSQLNSTHALVAVVVVALVAGVVACTVDVIRQHS